MEDFIYSVFCIALVESYNCFFGENDLYVNVLKLGIRFLCFQRFFNLCCKPLNIFLNCFKVNSHVWCSCNCLSELYCNTSPLHTCITVFTGFDANSVSKFLCESLQKSINISTMVEKFL